MRIATRTLAPLSISYSNAAVVQHVDHLAHGGLGIVLHVLHVGAHHLEAMVRGHGFQLRDAFLTGRDLGAQIGEVLYHIAHRPGAARQQRAHRMLEKYAAIRPVARCRAARLPRR